MMKRTINIITIFLFVISFAISLSAQDKSQTKSVRIGIVTDGPLDRNDLILDLFKNEIKSLFAGEYEIVFPRDKLQIADWTVDGIRNAVSGIIADPDVDIVLAMGILASNEICLRKNLQKPVMAPFIIDREIQKIPYKNGSSGVNNLCYISCPLKFKKDMDVYQTVFPFKKAALLLNSISYKITPDLADHIIKICKEAGLEIFPIPVGTSASEVLNNIPESAEAVFAGPLFHFPDTEFKKLADGLIEKKLPGFSSFERREIEFGLFAGNIADDFFQKRARRTALNIQRILQGEDAGKIPVGITETGRLVINMKTARILNIYPNFSVLTDAELINSIREEVSRSITLSEAVKEAVEVNLDLAAKKLSVLAGAQDVKEARSIVLPQIEISALQTFVDKDKAESSMGMQPERMLSGTAGITQILFSEPARSNLKIQQYLHKAREENWHSLKLDIAREAANSYLNLLKAKKVEDIQRKNLKLTQSNLEMARLRRAVGMSGPSDVYRWESEIATNRKQVIETNSVRNVAEIKLNRILHRPLEESFLTEETGFDEPALITSDERFLKYYNNPWTFKVFRNFFVKSGLEASPELKSLQNAVKAQKKAYNSARSAFWAPVIVLKGAVSNIYSREGAGTDPLQIPAINLSFPEAKDFSWNIGLSASFPIFKGGSKIAKSRKAKKEVEKLEIEKNSAAETLEQNIRQALHISGAAYVAISLSNESADAADKNLKLVKDAYSRGAVSIIELIDAQKAALGADLGAANALYDFFINLINVQRAAGFMFITFTQEEKDSFFNGLEEFYINSQNNK